MEKSGQSPPVTATSPPREQDEASFLDVKKGFLSFFVSLQKGFRYVEAFFVGQTKRVVARNENEAARARADLETSKMQVEATDEAEVTKKRLHLST